MNYLLVLMEINFSMKLISQQLRSKHLFPYRKTGKNLILRT